MALISAFVLLFVAWGECDDSNASEYYGCLLVAAAGVSFVGRANDLITLFLALETAVHPDVHPAVPPARTRVNQEAAAKYFLLSVMSSGPPAVRVQLPVRADRQHEPAGHY
jgi:NADH-quinone oxidoreductase subunit N